QGVSWLVHANSRVLFGHYYAILIFQGAAYGLLYGFEFVRLRFACWHFDFRIVMVIRSAAIAAILASHWIMVSVSVERLISSIWPLQFEQCTRRFFGFFIGSSIIAISFVVTFYALSDGFRLFATTRNVLKMDLRIKDNKEAYDLTFQVMAYTYVPSSLIFAADCYLNFFKKRKQNITGSLAISYQYAENRKVISIILPLEITNATVTIFGTIAQAVYNAVNPDATEIQRSLFVELTALSSLFPLAFAIIIEWRVGYR
ncbi:hypothetical protein PMAYCL1PPCAC_25364, partial [Pristionchus mayeri]